MNSFWSYLELCFKYGFADRTITLLAIDDVKLTLFKLSACEKMMKTLTNRHLKESSGSEYEN